MLTHRSQHDLPVLTLNAAEIAVAVKDHKQRLLLFGPMGAGKSTLTAQLADALTTHQRPCWCLNADPGSPAFGVPGPVSLAMYCPRVLMPKSMKVFETTTTSLEPVIKLNNKID